MYVKTELESAWQLFYLEELFLAVLPAPYGNNQIYQMFVLPKEWRGMSRTSFFAFEKYLPKTSCWTWNHWGFPLPIPSFCPVLFTDVILKYWLSSAASQFVAKAVMALIEVTTVLITQHNASAFLISGHDVYKYVQFTQILHWIKANWPMEEQQPANTVPGLCKQNFDRRS